ncbi:hypothetical protein, partial [Streptomyces sp. NPDC008317]|uniref:hypothetical protein n=1 Tax=Streptomyces sp. NPDC008317 TaxID=3364827 RepID=UPI0036E098F1
MRKRILGRWGSVLGVATTGVVIAAGAPAVAAAPDVPTQAVALVDSVKPVLTAKVSSSSGGQVTAKFFAGTYAAGGAW